MCDAQRPCCEGVGLECRNDICNYVAEEASAVVAVDAEGLNVEEGTYEIRVVTFCGGGVSTASEPVLGRIDRVVPRLFGEFQEPADRLWWPVC